MRSRPSRFERVRAQDDQRARRTELLRRERGEGVSVEYRDGERSSISRNRQGALDVEAGIRRPRRFGRDDGDGNGARRIEDEVARVVALVAVGASISIDAPPRGGIAAVIRTSASACGATSACCVVITRPSTRRRTGTRAGR